MAQSKSVDNTSAGLFSEFPVFTKLTLENKPVYDRFISRFPPIDDISFASLVSWWGASDVASVSRLNDNLIISYWLPGSGSESGLGIVGTTDLDETICAVFDMQRQKGDEPRLVHVSEFLLPHIRYPEMFNFVPMPEYDEYILDIATYTQPNKTSEHLAKRVAQFAARTAGRNIDVRQLDLRDEANVALLIEAANRWPNEGTINELVTHSSGTLQNMLMSAETLGTESLCLFVDDELQAYILFTRSHDPEYVIFTHAKVSYDIPNTYEFMIYAFAEWMLKHGVKYINISFDLGLPNLRRLKLQFGPSRYFRKFIIEPAPQPI